MTGMYGYTCFERVESCGIGVWRSELRDTGSGFEDKHGFRASSSGLWVLSLGVRISGFGF